VAVLEVLSLNSCSIWQLHDKSGAGFPLMGHHCYHSQLVKKGTHVIQLPISLGGVVLHPLEGELDVKGGSMS
jgi:hypothetical protein